MEQENQVVTDSTHDNIQVNEADLIEGLADFLDEKGLPVDEPVQKTESQESEEKVETEEESEEDYLADVDADDEEEDDTPEEDSEAEEEESSDDGEIVHTLDDGTELTAEEIDKGYLRQSDYTKKTQELAEQRKALESDTATMEYLKVQKEFQPKVIELNDLQREIDIAEKAIHYGRTEDGTQLTREEIEATKNNVDDAKRKHAYESEQLNKRMAETPPPKLDVLQDKVPELFSEDAKVRQPVVDNFADTMREIGYSELEIQSANDPRLLLLLKEVVDGRALAKKVESAKARKNKSSEVVSKSTKASQRKSSKSTSKPSTKSNSESAWERVQAGDMDSLGEAFEDLL